MPIYEYQCTECEHQLEAIQKVSDNPLVECPACGKPGLKKLVSAAAFHLKGTGWYETDFKGKPKTKKDSKQENASTKSDTVSTDGKKAKNDKTKSTGKEASSTASS